MSKKASPEKEFYRGLDELTDKAEEEGASLQNILEILTIHGLNTFLRDSDNSFCCATDMMLRIFSRWYKLNHDQYSASSCENDECFTSIMDDDEDSSSSLIH